MTHLAERVDRVFQLVVTLDTIFLAVVPTTADRTHFIGGILAVAITAWSIGYIRKTENSKLFGWIFLADATGIYWLFFFWADFHTIMTALRLFETPVFQLVTGAIWFSCVLVISLLLRTFVYRSVSNRTFLVLFFLILILTSYGSRYLVHP